MIQGEGDPNRSHRIGRLIEAAERQLERIVKAVAEFPLDDRHPDVEAIRLRAAMIEKSWRDRMGALAS